MFLMILYKKVATNRQLLLIVACFRCGRFPRIPFAEGDYLGAGSGSRRCFNNVQVLAFPLLRRLILKYLSCIVLAIWPCVK